MYLNNSKVRNFFSDKLEGSHLRYTCGHTACGECTEGVNQCLLCLTPPEKDTSRQAEFDGPLTNRVNNISALIKACQESFGIDGQYFHTF